MQRVEQEPLLPTGIRQNNASPSVLSNLFLAELKLPSVRPLYHVCAALEARIRAGHVRTMDFSCSSAFIEIEFMYMAARFVVSTGTRTGFGNSRCVCRQIELDIPSKRKNPTRPKNLYEVHKSNLFNS